MGRVVPTPKPVQASKLVLPALHVLLSAVLTLISVLAHGPVPGLSADESAALGFIFFFFLGLPLVLIGVGTLVWSLLSKDNMHAALAGLLVVSVVAVANLWTGILASLAYLSLAVWTMAQRLRQRI